MSDPFSRVKIITGVVRRRRFTTEQKLTVVAEEMQPGLSFGYVARRHGLSQSRVFRWRRLMTEADRLGVAESNVAERVETSCWIRGQRPATATSNSPPKSESLSLVTLGTRVLAPMATASSPRDPTSAGILTARLLNGEAVRVAFAPDGPDGKVIGWVATTTGISGEMIRALVVGCVETRFIASWPPYSVRWLADKGSFYPAAKTIEMAVAH